MNQESTQQQQPLVTPPGGQPDATKNNSNNNSNPQVSAADLAAAMQAQGLPASAQSQIMAAVMGSMPPPAGSTVDMASVLAKIQVLSRPAAQPAWNLGVRR
jgi:hypothetical protein